MVQFDNLDDLEKYIKGMVKDVLKNDVAKEIYKIIENYLYENVYKTEPKEYTRTYELWDSLTISEIFTDDRGRTTVELYFDTEKIQHHIVSGNWNQHADVNGIDTSLYIPLWVEEGTSGSLWDREPANVLGDSFDELEQTRKHIDILMKKLKEYGFDIKFK